KNVNDKWKKVYGRPFPASETEEQDAVAKNLTQEWHDTEEFIEDRFRVDIREAMNLDCEVKQDGFRTYFLSRMLAKKTPLLPKKSLLFKVTEISTGEPYDIYWKVLNRGEAARKRDCIRGQIVEDEGWM